ncbi:DUF6442 family protein [Eggerthella guodeyinii]|uniref:Uncharacterized protein n=1 Tax=Eggerthella guodeyinii TaxID=2690837 RepID=A0A6N7RMW8_9ACTN|nr:DUF6442 family protein [Eggerthella guodeyinii]MRX82088.1 hypothetical protein [Eggerthella guodeyinii]
MDKDEILEKSRRDGGEADERFTMMEQRMGLIAMSAAAAAFCLLYAWDFFHGQNTDGLFAVFFIGLTTMCLYRFYQLRMKSLLFGGLFTGFFAVYSAVQYILATM